MLRDAIRRASQSPFYDDYLKSKGWTWHNLLDFENFSQLPIISKSFLRANISQFIPPTTRIGDRTLKTSGTTGESLSFPVSCNVEANQWAVWWRYRSWHGISMGTKSAIFASSPVVVGALKGRPWRFNSANNEYRFSIFHISKETAPIYAESLNSIQPKWIHGNPTAISALASHLFELGIKLRLKLICVTVGSENLLGWQKTIIEKVFDCKVFQHYGLAEAVANISECELGNLHVDEDYSHVEFLNSDESGTASIVGTTFHNHALTVLRYDTGDLARLSSASCKCGHPGRLVQSLDGRLTDYITLPDGQRVASLAAPFHSTENLHGAQIYQSITGDLVIRYIPGPNWSDSQLHELEKSLRIRVGPTIPISFLMVDSLEKTPRGKMKLVISDYQNNFVN
jgi:phenylacetate-CoA ligase